MHDGKKECRLIVVGDGKKGSRSVNNSAKRRLKGDLIEPDCILQVCAVGRWEIRAAGTLHLFAAGAAPSLF